ncbi:MAG: trimethylamine methyltransferase family protein [Desulfobacterales bacterium]|nr:MAG: trimethylamine methyltransferase family protein [Desulfobacterales bacterium]
MIPTTSILSKEEMHEIDRASRELLWDVGVTVYDEKALELYKKAGAEIDVSRQIVRLPSYLISETLSKCSPSIQLYGRDGIPPMNVGGMRSYFGTIGFASNALDVETETHRPVTSQDLVDIFRLSDVLEPPHFLLTPGTPSDVPTELSDLYEFKIGLMNARKHLVIQAKGEKNLDKIIKMASEVAGGFNELQRRPFLSILVTLTSPLTLRSDSAELIIGGAKKGLPLFIESGPMCGGTAPATLAATLVMANAELLNSFILAKIVNPAVPLVYASWARILDMRTGGVSHGGPEFGMLRIGTTQMAKFYNLPSGGGGILADTKLIDAQLGMEKIGTALLPALAGTNMILGMGLFAEENTMSQEILMIDHEVACYAQRVLQGILVNDNTINLSIFKDAAPTGTYLDTEHTLENFKKEMWIPLISSRGRLEETSDLNLTGMRSNAKKAIIKAMEEYNPPSLPDDIDFRLEDIIQA